MSHGVILVTLTERNPFFIYVQVGGIFYLAKIGWLDFFLENDDLRISTLRRVGMHARLAWSMNHFYCLDCCVCAD